MSYLCVSVRVSFIGPRNFVWVYALRVSRNYFSTRKTKRDQGSDPFIIIQGQYNFTLCKISKKIITFPVQ